MRLERLHIQGFKSFKDRTTIHFDDGITGIVGPNGCGKSNIVDALFWVMGEQSAKHLRGVKMSDLIFSGSKKYSPGSFAEVTLVLNNSERKHIHIGSKVVSPQEIELTRKLYRNGETEYRINGLPARLKDIQEVFMDTGAGAKSYSIIAQGEIDRLVKAKPVERRVMIEEVAGITKFKMRKKESLRKIDQTNLNLERINDLKKEIHKTLKKLEGQAEKAEKARVLKEKVKKNALVVNSHRELDFLENIQLNNDEITANAKKVEELKIEKESLDASLETEKNKKTELIDSIDGLQEEFNEQSKELVSLEERFSASKGSVEEKKSYIDEKRDEIASLEADLQSRKQRINETKEELSELDGSSKEESSDYSDLEEQVEVFRQEIEEMEAQHLKNIKERELASERVSSVESRIFKNTTQLEDQARLLQETTQEIEELEDYFSQLTDDSEIKKEKLKQGEEKLLFLEKQKATIEEKLSDLTTEKETLRNDLNEKEKLKVETATRLQSLEEVNLNSFERTGSLKFVEQEREGDLLRDALSVPEEMQRAVEVLLSPYMETIFGKSLEEKVDTWFEQNKESLSYLSSNVDYGLDEEIEGESLSLLLKENRSTETLENFLKQFYLVDSLTANEVKSLESKNFLAIGTKDGSKVVRKVNGNILFEITNVNAIEVDSSLERSARIDELKIQLASIEEEVSKSNEIFSRVNTQIVKTQEEKEEAFNEYNELKEELIGLKSSIASESGSYSVNKERLERLIKKKKEVSTQRIDLCEEEEALEEERENLFEELGQVKEKIVNFEESFNERKLSYEDLREKLLEVKSDQKSHDFKKQQFEKQLKDLYEQKESIVKKIETAKDAISNAEESIQNLDDSRGELEERISSLSEELKNKELVISELRSELDLLLEQMKDREGKWKKIQDEITTLENDTFARNVKLEKLLEDEELLVRNTFEEYHVDLREILMRDFEDKGGLDDLKDTEEMFFLETEEGIRRIEAEDYEFQKKFPGQIKEAKEKLKNFKSSLNRLGHINWQAVEDYDKQKIRYDFLKGQEEELKTSINDLLTAIERIDTKSKFRFEEAFKSVNDKFERVFPIIFGGGYAKLQMVGKLDDDDFGIEIVASPPGKKMQNINLMSGGEKALTAVALIFSIFLVKPSPFCLLDEVDAPLDDANVGRFNQLLREMSSESQFILITHNKKTMELNDRLYGITMQEPGVSKTISVQIH